MKSSSKIFILFIILVVISAAPGAEFPKEGRWQARFVFSFCQRGDKPGQLLSPAGISTDPKGNVYVADTGNNRIQKFDSRGKLVAFIGGFGWESEQFQRPVDICAENGLDVFVADYENNRIERYDKDLNWITSILSDPNAEEKLRFAFPNSVSISIHGDLFLVDSENKRILKLNTLRRPEFSFGDYDWGQGDLTEPMQVYVSRKDRIYVSDRDAGCVFVYDYYGNYLHEIGRGILEAPNGLCVDGDEHLFVADGARDQVLVFDGSGYLILEIGSSGEKLGAFRNPGDVAIHQDHLYVADTDNHRIQVFRIQPIEAKEQE